MSSRRPRDLIVGARDDRASLKKHGASDRDVDAILAFGSYIDGRMPPAVKRAYELGLLTSRETLVRLAVGSL